MLRQSRSHAKSGTVHGLRLHPRKPDLSLPNSASMARALEARAALHAQVRQVDVTSGIYVYAYT